MKRLVCLICGCSLFVSAIAQIATLCISTEWTAVVANIRETPGLTEKPLYKIQEICSLFKITKPTIYAWIKHGKLKRVKIRSRVYFLDSNIRQLICS